MEEIDLSDVQIMDNQIGEIVTKVYNIIKSRSLQFNNISQRLHILKGAFTICASIIFIIKHTYSERILDVLIYIVKINFNAVLNYTTNYYPL